MFDLPPEMQRLADGPRAVTAAALGAGATASCHQCGAVAGKDVDPKRLWGIHRRSGGGGVTHA